MTCLPCVKEIINSGLDSNAKSLRSLAENVPHMVRRGQVTKARAEKFYNDVIALEKKFCYDSEHMMMDFLDDVKNPWEVD